MLDCDARLFPASFQKVLSYGSFGFVVPMILVVDFMGNAINFFQKSLASVLVPFCMDDRFTRKFSECSQKSLFSSGLTYFW